MKCIFFSALFFFAATSAAADDWIATIVPSPLRSEQIEGLSFEGREVQVVPDDTTADGLVDARPAALLRGRFARPGWALIQDNGSVLVPEAPGDFEIKVPLRGSVTPLRLTAINREGEIESAKQLVQFNDLSEWNSKGKKSPPKRNYLLASLMLSHAAYAEAGRPDYSLDSLTFKFSWQYLLFPPNWDVAASGYVTALPLRSNDSANTVRYVGLNLRAGYVVPQISAPWRLSIMAGWYYMSMLVTQNHFGFRNLSGPTLFPVIRRTFENKDSLSAYFKFSPIADGWGLMAISNREVAVGLTWTRPLSNGHPIGISADFSDFQFKIGSTGINSRSYSLGLGYGF